MLILALPWSLCAPNVDSALPHMNGFSILGQNIGIQFYLHDLINYNDT